MPFDSASIDKMRWLTMPMTAGMLRLRLHMDGLRLLVMQIDLPLI